MPSNNFMRDCKLLINKIKIYNYMELNCIYLILIKIILWEVWIKSDNGLQRKSAGFC